MVCVYDPRFVKLGSRPSERAYFAQEHVIVSYNGDLRGFVEDSYGRERRVRCAVAMFSAVGAIVEGTALIATMPDIVAHQLVKRLPHLRLARFPLPRSTTAWTCYGPPRSTPTRAASSCATRSSRSAARCSRE